MEKTALAIILALTIASTGCLQQTAGVTGNTIEITSNGFSPSTLVVKQGQIVVFVNKDTQNHWPASGFHPTHTLYPEPGGCIGSAFDACYEMRPGDSYSFTFNHKGAWQYHDHLNSRLTGIITVE